MASPREFLVFRLWGPMVSWGMIAVGEQRHSWTRPSRSALLGLVAAALGIERSDAAPHLLLEGGLALAIRVDRPGHPMRDYHTTQTPQSQAKRRWRSRHDEIHGSKHLNTILSDRDYLVEASAVIALWQRAASKAPPLAEIAARLQKPVFTPYLGRKASPLGLPLAPQLVAATTLAAALAAFDTAERARTTAPENARRRWLVPRPSDPTRG